MELHISFPGVIGVIICVAILLWLLNRYFFGPISQILEKREGIFESSRKKAERNLKSIEKKTAHYRASVNEAKEDAQEKLKKGVELAHLEKSKILVEAEETSEKLIARKLKEIQRDEMESEHMLEEQTPQLANLILENLLKK